MSEISEMGEIRVTKEALSAKEKYQLPREEIGFGKVIAPVMIELDYQDGQWGTPELVPYGPLTLSPTCKVFHYAQEIFEGMKAYRVEGHGPYLFRPEQNAKRFQVSAARMAMPELPEETFINCVKCLVAHSQEFIPQKSGESLYIRPFMMATEEHLGIKPSNRFKFMVLASPSGAYFTESSLKILIERRFARACPGGTGYAKTGGNYAASLKSVFEAREEGYDQTLWLDACEQKYVEELSGMNFFAVIDGILQTPPLGKTLLNGITRNSLLQLAQHLGYQVQEKPLRVDELTQAIEQKRCTEAFSCGTAAIITPIGELFEVDGTRYKLPERFGPVAKELRETLLAIQEGRKEDPFGWVVSPSWEP